jgi:hypothetical protein
LLDALRIFAHALALKLRRNKLFAQKRKPGLAPAFVHRKSLFDLHQLALARRRRGSDRLDLRQAEEIHVAHLVHA